MSPDEFKGGPEELYTFADDAASNPTFYADITEPQSLNKYQYAYNNPLNRPVKAPTSILTAISVSTPFRRGGLVFVPPRIDPNPNCVSCRSSTVSQYCFSSVLISESSSGLPS